MVSFFIAANWENESQKRDFLDLIARNALVVEYETRQHGLLIWLHDEKIEALPEVKRGRPEKNIP